MPETHFIAALLSIVAIDLVLAGDNAVLIALASRNLPMAQRSRAIYWGTFGAIAIRALMTMAAVWLLRIPYLQALGGLLLIPVAVKLITQEKPHEDIRSSDSFIDAIKTIIIADAIMGVDNVLAIAGASHGNMVLVILGLLISVPIVVWSSKWITAWMDRFPALVYAGAAILSWTAGSMIIHDRIVGVFLAGQLAAASWLVPAIVTVLVLLAGRFGNRVSI